MVDPELSGKVDKDLVLFLSFWAFPDLLLDLVDLGLEFSFPDSRIGDPEAFAGDGDGESDNDDVRDCDRGLRDPI